MITLQELKTLFQEPRTFFKQRSKEVFGTVFLFGLLVIAIGSLSALPSYVKQFTLSPVWFGPAYIIILCLSALILFAITGIVHLSLRSFGGQGTYTNTVQSYVYGGLPSFLWAIPLNAVGYFLPQTVTVSIILMILSLPVYIYSIYLTLVGSSFYHKIGMGRAFLALFLPLFILGIITIIILVLFFTIAAVTTTTGI